MTYTGSIVPLDSDMSNKINSGSIAAQLGESMIEASSKQSASAVDKIRSLEIELRESKATVSRLEAESKEKNENMKAYLDKKFREEQAVNHRIYKIETTAQRSLAVTILLGITILVKICRG